MDPRLQLLRSASAGDAEVALIIRLRDPAVIPPGVRVVSQFGDIATVRLLGDQILDVRAHEATESLKAPELMWREDEQAIDSEFQGENSVEGDEAQPTDFQRPLDEHSSGRGVVIGVADWGCDFAHPAFRQGDGSTRLLALWDQRDLAGRAPNNEYGYGFVHRREAIDAALVTTDPYRALSYHPADAETKGEAGSHGTHTLGIAAGNTLGGGPGGIAPEADLIFVHLAGGPAPLSTLGTSVNLLEAIDFIFKLAGQRPCVINLSLGQQAGSHDGTSPVERGLDAALLAVPGRLICQSCGNYYNRRIHASGELRPGEQRVLRIVTGETQVIPNEVDFWYSREDLIRIAVRAPDGTETGRLTTGDQAALRSDGMEIGRLYVRANDPNNGNHHAALFIFPGAPAGTWELKLWGEDIVDGRFNCWIERNSVAPGSQPRFVPDDAVELSTTGTICNGYRTIAVGAYDAHSPDHGLATFSSRGPTADGRWKPDIAAPGVAVLSARSAPRDVEEQQSMLTRKSGTSMASPHVAGTAALLYEITGPIPIQDMRRLMLATADTASGPDEVAMGLGSGYLNIAAATAAAREYVENAKRISGVVKREATGHDHSMGDQEMTTDADVESVAYWRTADEMPTFSEDASSGDLEAQTVVERPSAESVASRMVRIADAIAVRPGNSHPDELLAAAVGGTTRPPRPAELFDTYMLGERHPFLDSATARFEVVGQPGTGVVGLREGDLVISRQLGEPDIGSVRVIGSSGSPTWAVVGASANVPVNSIVIRQLPMEGVVLDPSSPLHAWDHLVSLRPPTTVQMGLRARGHKTPWVTHHIEDAWGDLNLDYYPVELTRLPSIYRSGADLLSAIRRNLNAFVDTSIAEFSPLDPAIDSPGWAADPPVLGTVVHIKLKMAWGYLKPDDGSVVVSEAASDHWTFSTCWTEPDHAHPVSGNREFGFFTNATGSLTFYTKGADRTTQLVDYSMSFKVFGAADTLWRSLQGGIANFVNRYGGSASILAPLSARYPWEVIRLGLWHPDPSVPWC